MSQSQTCYLHSGFLIESDIVINEWEALRAPVSFSTADISIRLSQFEPPFKDGDYAYTVPGVGTYVVRAGSEIFVTPEFGCDPRDVSLCLSASAWSALCHQRGIYLLHGSAIRAEGKAFAFSGHSGAGKSTMAAWLARQNYEVVSDDTSRLVVVGNEVVLYPSVRRVKLWKDTINGLGLSVEGLAQVATEFDKYYIPIPGPSTIDSQRLDGVYILAWGELGLRRLTGGEALRSFLDAATYRPEFLEPLGAKRSFVQNAISIVQHVPIFELSRPKDLNAISETVALLERQWKDDFS